MKLKKLYSRLIGAGTTIDLKNSIISLIDGSGARDVQTVTCDAKVNATTGDYIVFYVGGSKHAAWFDLTGSDIVPTVSGVGAGEKHKVDISGDTSDDDVAGTLSLVLNSVEGIEAIAIAEVVRVTQEQFGVITAISIVNAVITTATAVVTPGAASKKVEITVGDGNLTWSEKRNIEYHLDRGKLDATREGDEVPMDVSFQFRYTEITAVEGQPATVSDILKKKGEASDWVSSDVGDCGAPYCVDIEILHTPPCATVHSERIILPKYRYEDLSHDPKAGTVSSSGKCNVTQAHAIREAQS